MLRNQARNVQESNQRTRVQSKSAVAFGLGAAMFVSTIAMTAVGGLYGAVLSAGLTATFFGYAINKRSQERRAARSSA